jgi:hypothetical protein
LAIDIADVMCALISLPGSMFIHRVGISCCNSYRWAVGVEPEPFAIKNQSFLWQATSLGRNPHALCEYFVALTAAVIMSRVKSRRRHDDRAVLLLLGLRRRLPTRRQRRGVGLLQFGCRT